MKHEIATEPWESGGSLGLSAKGSEKVAHAKQRLWCEWQKDSASIGSEIAPLSCTCGMFVYVQAYIHRDNWSRGLESLRVFFGISACQRPVLTAEFLDRASKAFGMGPALAFSTYLNQPKPTILQVPNRKPYMEFLGTLQNSRFWLV